MHIANDNQMDDTVLAGFVGAGLAIAGLCMIVATIRVCSRRPQMKPSRSDNDLENLQDLVSDAIPANR